MVKNSISNQESRVNIKLSIESALNSISNQASRVNIIKLILEYSPVVAILPVLITSCDNGIKQLEQRQREQKAAIIKLIDNRLVRTESLLLGFARIDVNNEKSLYYDRYNEYYVNSFYKWNEEIESLYQSIIYSNHSSSPGNEIEEIKHRFDNLQKELVNLRYKIKKPLSCEKKSSEKELSEKEILSCRKRLCVKYNLHELSKNRKILIKKLFPNNNDVLNNTSMIDEYSSEALTKNKDFKKSKFKNEEDLKKCKLG